MDLSASPPLSEADIGHRSFRADCRAGKRTFWPSEGRPSLEQRQWQRRRKGLNQSPRQLIQAGYGFEFRLAFRVRFHSHSTNAQYYWEADADAEVTAGTQIWHNMHWVGSQLFDGSLRVRAPRS